EKRPPKPLYGEGQIVYNSTVVDLNYYSLPDEEICSKQVSINNKIQGKQLWSFLVAVFKYHAHADGIRISFHCNGILVSKRVVVTSAHSFRRPGQWYLPHEFFLSLGQQNIFSQRELAVKVQDIIIHPDFLLKDEFDADLALLIMSERVKYSDHIQPVCLWEGQNFVTTNKDEAILVGWARESQTQVPGESQTDIAPLASEEMCLRSNPVFSKIISDRTLCVGRRDNREACYISGAAMLMDTHKNGELVRQLRGILAASLLDPITNTCNLNDYFLATDLAKFADWIKYFIQNADLS
ncbi:Serine protease gd, partial [Pseudolycoriella hygida]